MRKDSGPTYQRHWGLRQSPYREGLDPRDFRPAPFQDEALARLQFLLQNQRRLGLLIGPSGTGKSLLLEVFARQIRRQGTPAAKVDLLGADGADLHGEIATGWQIAGEPTAPSSVLWRRLVDRLAEFRAMHATCVVLLDNADEASPIVLQQVLRLIQTDPLAGSPLTVIAAARPDRVDRLGARLLDMSALRIDLLPWEADETSEFVQSSLARAGRPTPAFDVEALERLHELSGGIPRRVSQSADLALVAGAGQRLNQIDRETVDAVYQELFVR